VTKTCGAYLQHSQVHGRGLSRFLHSNVVSIAEFPAAAAAVEFVARGVASIVASVARATHSLGCTDVEYFRYLGCSMPSTMYDRIPRKSRTSLQRSCENIICMH